jgi:UDP-2,4-diacetamido-2,4,6-trideoxy-beta-L-altropyranose hydrolase
MQALFRVDSSSLIGSGHLMRCLTLAQALRDSAVDCQFICRPHDRHSAALVQQQGFALILLPAITKQSSLPTEVTGYQSWLGCTEQQDAADCIAEFDEVVDWLIVDHYALGAEFCTALRAHCQQILVIDDLANRLHDCDWLLDQNLLPDQHSRYQQLVPATCKLLLGPQFALLRDEFYQTPNVARQAGRVLVFFGGNDPFQLTIKSAMAITHLSDVILHADIVISAQHPDRAQLEALCQSHPNIQLHVQCNHMASLMHQAQLMLGAGGSTHWERCICALPALVVTVAENQLPTTRHLHQLGACHWLGHADSITQSGLQQTLRDWLAHPDRLHDMAQRAKNLMAAGQGARTVCQHLLR